MELRSHAQELGDGAQELGDDDAPTCVICLEPIEKDKSVVLRCAHAFHGQCLCDHLVRDRRCPICRDQPDEFEWPYSEEEGEESDLCV